ncbi:LOW QUALITY PROTEIN: vinculin-like [Acropora millepora]|uniref:LOW QUALITY PROTEIN: vinculin-like n=1 Tax=Acropora millepora TaxID=45264 RepID=UPI001CF53FC7|nr:LOW QUALITY PROTEIN: vinculin-like [Acropora millepora]
MPVFHTKIIESILEPVAQQVSTLVILHEEAEDGKAMPDLALPVQAVGAAVQNLVKVGKETAASSKDQILKEEMPLAFTRVEESSILLVEASHILRTDPYSSAARKKLIDGARGILSGTSALLLTFDEAEVRKILKVCRGVLEYLSVAEIVESMEELVTFVKNLTPGITEMAKKVEARIEELTHQVHADMLKKSITAVKAMSTQLITSIKTYVLTVQRGGQSMAEAQEYRNFVVGKMCFEISEIIRVLQYTTYEEEGGDDPLNDMKKAASLFDSNMGAAMKWVATPTESSGGLGERAVRECITQGRKFADACQGPDKGRIKKVCDDLDELMGNLAQLRKLGKGTTPEGQKLNKEVSRLLDDLNTQMQNATLMQERSGVRRPATTFAGKMDQVHQWMNNPSSDPSGLGERAIRECIEEGRGIAEKCSGPERSAIVQLCDDLDLLTDEIAGMMRRGMGNSPQAAVIAQKIEKKLEELNNKLQNAAIAQVAEDFMDTTSDLKQLEKAAKAPADAPDREAEFESKSAAFEDQANQIADTAVKLANAGGNTNKRLLDQIRQNAEELKELTPQVSHVAKILLDYGKHSPSDVPAVSVHFDSMRDNWKDKMQTLTNLVDSATDTGKFIEACETAINQDAEMCNAAMDQGNPQLVITKSSNIARRAKRVVDVAEAEMENSLDPDYVSKVQAAKDTLGNSITPLVIDAKAVATNPSDRNAQRKLRDSTRKLQGAVSGVRVIVRGPSEPAEEDFPPPPPDISGLQIASETAPQQEMPPPRPPLPKESAPPPRPPLPSDEMVEVQQVLEQPPEDNRMAMAAHHLHREALKWDEEGNEIIQAAKKMAILFAKMSQFMRDAEEGQPQRSKKELIALAKEIAAASKEVSAYSAKIAKNCPDKRVGQTLSQTIERIPTISTQLKIVATVKATMIGADDPQADLEATETLVGCAENLMAAVRQAVKETEAASVKMRSAAISFKKR